MIILSGFWNAYNVRSSWPLRVGPRGFQTIKNIDAYISAQVITALGERVFPQEIESNLLAIRALFQKTKGQSLKRDIERMEQGRRLIQEIRTVLENPAGQTTTLQTLEPSPGNKVSRAARCSPEPTILGLRRIRGIGRSKTQAFLMIHGHLPTSRFNLPKA